ncbi:aldo/keto reductase [Chloroflexota bacterium]
MEKVRLGKTELLVTRLGFGGVPIQRLPEKEAITLIRESLELGVNFIDTANSYTNSEERIGKAIKDWRDQIILATKSTSRNKETLKENIYLSLRRLGVDYLDLYQFHDVSNYDTLEMILNPNGLMSVLKQAKKEKLIRHIGISCHSIDVAKWAVKSGQFETVMFPFNFITCEAEYELLQLTREYDVGFIAMKPFAGGRIRKATIALKYLFQFPGVVPIPGIENNGEMAELIQILEGPSEMTERENNKIQVMRDELGTQFCRRCDYCQPCNAGIPISSALAISNPEKRMPPERLFYGEVNDILSKAAECTRCGDCEERCPYNLPIREMLSKETEWYQQAKINYLERTPL